ncbi:hypothetical protein M9Y10_004573, partial [Tritrichomonas musculus]
QVLKILKKAYPNFYKGFSKGDSKDAIDLWAMMFEDEDVFTVANAVKAHIAMDEKGFPPVIGQIKSKIQSLSRKSIVTEFEAWEKVKNAVRNSLYNSGEEYAKLPENIQKLIGSSSTLREWAMLDISELDTVVQSNFMRSYRAGVEYEKEYLAMPKSVREFIEEISESINSEKKQKESMKFMNDFLGL